MITEYNMKDNAETILRLQEQIKVLKRNLHTVSKEYNCTIQSAGLGSPTLWKKGKDF